MVSENNFTNNSIGTIGTAAWGSPIYTMNKDGLVRIIDPDLNTNENIVENLRINVWSDSDPRGISTNIIETDKDTGIFEGKVTFTTNGESNGHILYISIGDTVTVEYKDQSLPPPYDVTDRLDILAVTTIIDMEDIPGPILHEMTISSSNNNTKYAKQGDALIVTLVADRNLTGPKHKSLAEMFPFPYTIILPRLRPM